MVAGMPSDERPGAGAKTFAPRPRRTPRIAWRFSSSMIERTDDMADQAEQVQKAEQSDQRAAGELLHAAAGNVRQAARQLARRAAWAVSAPARFARALPGRARAAFQAKVRAAGDRFQQSLGGRFLTWEEIEEVRARGAQGAIAARERQERERLAAASGAWAAGFVDALPASDAKAVPALARFCGADGVEQAAWDALSTDALRRAAGAGRFDADAAALDVCADDSWCKHELFAAAQRAAVVSELFCEAAHVYAVDQMDELGDRFAGMGERLTAEGLAGARTVAWFTDADMMRVQIGCGAASEGLARAIAFRQALAAGLLESAGKVPALLREGEVFERFDDAWDEQTAAEMEDALRNLAYWRNLVDDLARASR